MTRNLTRTLLLAAALLSACPAESTTNPEDDAGLAADATLDPPDATDSTDATDADVPDTDVADADADDAGLDADAAAPAACPGDSDPANGIVLTRDGALEGALDDGVWSFKGVPFAAPPVGDLRWQPPSPHGCHDASPRPSVTFGPVCPQPDGDDVRGDEDCLTLNVWTASPGDADAPRPVLVFIHGGGNQIGSASEEVGPGRALYDGARYARDHDVVVVTLQYRLGALGYLALVDLTAESRDASSGTYGHLDQIAALEWVRDHAAAFGGDPGRVMIFGESAGAINTCTLVASPLARGLFHAALMQSGTCGSEPLALKETQGAAAVATLTACDGSADLLACLRALPASDLVEGIPGFVGLVRGDLPPERAITYGPASGTPLLPRPTWDILSDGDHARVPLVVGSNAEEAASKSIFPIEIQTAQQYTNLVNTYGAFFGPGSAERILTLYPVDDYDTPQDALVQVFTDASFTCSARRIARLASAHGDTYRYFFTRRPETRNGSLPARHGIELLHAFGTLSDIPLFTPREADLALSREMMSRWSALASGDPNHPEGLTWEPYDAARDNHLVLGDEVTAAQGLRAAKCDLWDDLLGVD